MDNNNQLQTTSSRTPSRANGQAGQQGQSGQLAQRGGRPTGALTPPVDVMEDSGGITLYADLPGISRDKLNLHIEADTLTIDAESDLPMPEGFQASHTEVGTARFHRVFTLSKELDTEQVSAEFAQGVLRLRIPKAQHAQPRRVEVKVA